MVTYSMQLTIPNVLWITFVTKKATYSSTCLSVVINISLHIRMYMYNACCQFVHVNSSRPLMISRDFLLALVRPFVCLANLKLEE